MFLTTTSCPLNIELGGGGVQTKTEAKFLGGLFAQDNLRSFSRQRSTLLVATPRGRLNEYLRGVLGSIARRPAQY